MSNTNKTFNIAFVFMSSEKEENYVWAMKKLQSLMDVGREPEVFVTDYELALRNAITKVFPGAIQLICTWHIMKCLPTNCKHKFKKNEEFEIA